ncbi:phosphoribosylglycinamide formyltransferase [Veillonella caviae]|uniref:phosphoribosylglycinamide formyltransferase n=1 Tax=Veillonella caviae TaxID=248316 RepID=UPI002353C7F6|nr:phosphoribosylglycinamide formyltransferase [Veillonella caviae]MCI6406950.1 phosphoribosylglycinamide formyltransferase [Veillonella caviae]MDY6225976.1 phosphoribosylglycinamide formyltransferase [Veillonella caviae]
MMLKEASISASNGNLHCVEHRGNSNGEGRKKRLALFASGRGSNGEALYKAMQDGIINGEFVIIITDHGDAGIVERSKGWNIPIVVIERSDFQSKADFELAQLQALAPYDVDGIVLAGYMRIVGAPLIEAYEHKILNIHPALLPSFPGLHGHQQAIDAGVKITGCTVHFVDAGMDTGPIIMQNTVPVFADDTEDTLSERLLPVEHATYREALALFCNDALCIDGRIVSYKE